MLPMKMSVFVYGLPQTPGDMSMAVAAMWLNRCAEARVEPGVRGIIPCLVVVVNGPVSSGPNWFRGM